MFIYSSQLLLLLTWLILVDRDTLYGVNSHVHLLIAAAVVIDLAYSCGPRRSIWNELSYMLIYSSQLPLL